MKKFFFLITFLAFGKLAISCELNFNDNTNDVMNSWLGNSSEFSIAYRNGKCALDEALNKLPASQRRVIANLIAKSYEFDKNNKEKLLTYNY